MIAIIPARSGSKGLPGKNIKDLCGKPLIAYTIEAALESEFITDVIVSTDCEEIYSIAIKHGCNESFLRPKELAKDDSCALDNYLYTLDLLEKKQNREIKSFIVLQPTSPLRTSADIDNAIQVFQDRDADSVIGYCQESHPITWHKYIGTTGKFESIFDENILRNRQEERVSYYPNGSIYVFRTSLIRERRYYSDSSYPYVMPLERSVDIDVQADFDYAEYLMRKDK